MAHLRASSHRHAKRPFGHEWKQAGTGRAQSSEPVTYRGPAPKCVAGIEPMRPLW